MKEYFDSVNNWFKNKPTETIGHCIVCHSMDFNQQNCIATCKKCGFVWRYSAPTQETLDEFYKESDSMKQWSKIKQSDFEVQRQMEKYDFVYKKISELKIKKILDVGCGNGFFLNNCKDNVTKIGIEPNKDASDYCLFPIYSEYLSFKDSLHGHTKFDLITMFGVLEHLKNPIAEINKYKNHLSENGQFCFIVPNVDSLVVKTLGQECSTFCPQHLWYYNFTTLSSIMVDAGFEFGYATTVESEIKPILRKLNGIDPYAKEMPFVYPQELEDGILFNHMGYKIVTFFSKEIK